MFAGITARERVHMPTYDLACVSCESGFEVFLTRFLRDSDRVCPDCGASGATTLVTGFITKRPPRTSPEPRITGFAGKGCCGGACNH